MTKKMKEAKYLEKITFWPLQIYGWLLLTVVAYLKVSTAYPPSFLVLLYAIMASMSGFILSSALRTYYKKNQIIEKSFSEIIVVTIIGTFMFAMACAIFLVFIVPKLYVEFLVIHPFPLVVLNFTFLALLWNALYFMMKYIFLMIESFARQTLIAEKMKFEQLKTLRFQLKPHFLFNVLNSLHYLIKESPDRARNMTMHLAKYFQYILSDDISEIIPLKNEINLITEYFELQKIRFEEIFQTTISCSEKLLTVEIPGMIIFPIIENAVKYGYITHTDNYNINLLVREENKKLVIIVENDGQWVQEKEKTKNDEFVEYKGGIGLQNIRNRLKLHFENEWSLSHDEKDGKVIVTLILPFL
jgi:sensor histidine kinase YesM